MKLAERIEELINASEYEKAANLFLAETHSSIEWSKGKYKPQRWNKNQSSFEFTFTLSNSRGSHKGAFTESVVWSEKVIADTIKENTIRAFGGSFRYQTSAPIPSTNKTPSAYSLLASLGGYEAGTYKEFCQEFGYEGSEESLEVYEACKREFQDLSIMYSSEELEALQSIN